MTLWSSDLDTPHVEAIQDHDKNLVKFLHRCEAQGIILNTDKFTRRQKEMPFIGHSYR